MLRNPAGAAAILGVVAALAASAYAAPPKRIVAITPFSANTVAALGRKPVAIGQTLGGRERYVRSLRGVRTLPLAHPNGPNMEQLVRLRPGLVLSSHAWAKGNSTMKRLKLKVAVREPRRVRDVGREVRRIGKLIGRRRQARLLAAGIERSIALNTRQIKGRPRVLVVLGVGRMPYAFLPNSWGGDLVRRAGGRLLTAGAKARGGYARISDEAVVAANPEVILAVPHAREQDVPQLKEYLAKNPAWQTTDAARDKRIYVSVDNSLLQPGTDAAGTIRKVRSRYLRNR